MFKSLFVTGEFTVGKDTNDDYDNENDDKVFHRESIQILAEKEYEEITQYGKVQKSKV
jgi:hypothetical protein